MRLLSLLRPLSMIALAGLAFSACAQEDDEEENHDPVVEGSDWNSSYDEVVSNPCNGVKVPDNKGFNKRVALTFDDGPNTTTTPLVLDTLKKHKARAAFFINGRRVTGQAQRDLLARIVAEGHIVANHTQNHLNAATLSGDAFASEMNLTDAIVAKANKPVYFRFPFGSSTCGTANAVRSKGLKITGWHVDSGDWCFANAKEPGYCPASTFKYVPDSYRRDMTGYVLDQLKSFNGGIVLFHDIHGYTARNLDALMTEFEERGYTFTTVDDVAAFPNLNGAAEPPPAPVVGSPCTKDENCVYGTGSQAGFCYGYEQDKSGATTRGYCSLKCEGLCPGANTFCVSRDDVQADTGFCAMKDNEASKACASYAGTTSVTEDRYIGKSSAKPATADVCLGK
jgi:peptidoglycan/xylan/chitin deacetylase (PgdA/CDA1 family)